MQYVIFLDQIYVIFIFFNVLFYSMKYFFHFFIVNGQGDLRMPFILLIKLPIVLYLKYCES